MLHVEDGSYPVSLSVKRQWEFSRLHLVMRLIAAFGLYVVALPLMGVLFLLGPIITAVLAQRVGGDQFHARFHANYLTALQFLVSLNTYLLVATDAFPDWGVEGPAKVKVVPSGSPTAGSALVRIITVIPHIVALVVLGAIAIVASLLAMNAVLIDKTVPDFVWRFQVGFATWYARTFAYLYSMVEEYPPFGFEPPPPQRAGTQRDSSGARIATSVDSATRSAATRTPKRTTGRSDPSE